MRYRSLYRLRWFCILIPFFATLSHASYAQSPTSSHAAPLIQNIGTYGRKISTNSPLAQKFFDQGLRLTYGYYFPEAIASFQEAQRHDPDHPMIYWGLALAIGPNPNSRFRGFRDDPHGEGRKAIAAAQARAAKASEVERAFIEALAVRFDTDTYPNRSERDLKHIDATRAVFNRFPRDLDAGVLYADAIMTHSQWSYWRRDGSALPRTREAAAALEHVLRLNPDHPGAVHLYIHLFESSAEPERALKQANQLESLMPKAGHVVHMPAHIYVRVGQYDKAIASNERSINVDGLMTKAWGESAFPTIATYALSHRTHPRHALDFISYVAILQGNYQRALEAARGAAGGHTHMGAGAANRLQAIIWLVHKLFGKWDAVLAEPAPQPDSAYLRGLWHYVRGSAFVGKNDLEKAETELQGLKTAQQDPALKDLLVAANHATQILSLAAHGLEGEIALARGKHTLAVDAFKAALGIQDTLKYIEPPDWVPSMRLYLGNALIKAGRAREAEKVYREDLREFRENGWALFGLWQSLLNQKKTVAARKVRVRFEQAWEGADVTLQASIF